MDPFRQEVEKINNLVKKTGAFLLKRFEQGKNNHVKFKSAHEIVTESDILAEKIILTEIKKITPNFRIISEEAGDNEKSSDYTWIIDPLDGTTNFYMGNPLFAVQIALCYKKTPLFSWLYAPALKEFYFAQINKGAFLNNLPVGRQVKKIHVSAKKFQKSLLTYCHGSRDSELKAALKIYQHFKVRNFDIRQLGSAALEFAWVAKGRTEAYISPSAKLWDIVPGALLVQEAKGKVYDFKGNPWTMESKNVLATNGVVDKEILTFLKKL